MIRHHFVLLIIFGVFSSATGYTQSFAYKAGYFGFFDNREYFNDYVNDQTIFGSRISGELGYIFNDKNRIMAGVDYLYEFGSKGEWISPDFIAYYRGHYKNAGITLGAFPRENRISMPFSLLNDTLPYYRPNVEGILLDYKSRGFYHNIWIDWTGRQSLNKRESFLLGFTGYISSGILFYQHHFVMTHLAHSMNVGLEEHIRDNAGLTILPGADLSGIVPLDSLTLSAGILASYDRLRGIYDFSFPVGFLGEINGRYKRLGLQGTFYAGEEQIITSGDGFYQSDIYGRADIYYQVMNPQISGKVQFSMHFIPGVIDLSMSLVIKASINGVFRRHQSSSPK